jgi:hypothetical protein
MFFFALSPQPVGKNISDPFKLIFATFTRVWYIAITAIIIVFFGIYFSPLKPLIIDKVPDAQTATVTIQETIQQQILHFTFTQKVESILFLFGMLFFFYLFNLLVYRMKRTIEDPNEKITTEMLFILKKYFLLIVNFLLVFLLDIAGLYAFILPWLVVTVFLLFSDMFIMFEGKGVFSSIKSSVVLVWENYWHTLGTVLIPTIVLIYAFIFVIRPSFSSNTYLQAFIPSINFAFLIIVYWIMKALALVQYNDLKLKKTGSGLNNNTAA